MPHLEIHMSDGLHQSIDALQFLQSLHVCLGAQETIGIERIKSRILVAAHAIVGNADTANDFVHILLKIMQGREDALKQAMTQALFNKARDHLEQGSITLTVELQELDALTYRK